MNEARFAMVPGVMREVSLSARGDAAEQAVAKQEGGDNEDGQPAQGGEHVQFHEVQVIQEADTGQSCVEAEGADGGWEVADVSAQLGPEDEE